MFWKMHWILEFVKDTSLTKNMNVNEVDLYLMEGLEKKSPKFDIQNWWKVNSTKYPILAKVDRDVDESIICVSNIIFESVLFIFESVLFNLISFLELFYFNCKLFNFRNKYSKDSVLEQKKEDLELIRA